MARLTSTATTSPVAASSVYLAGTKMSFTSPEVAFRRWSSSAPAGDGRTKPKPFWVREKTPTTRGRARSERLRLRGESASAGSSSTGTRGGARGAAGKEGTGRTR